MNKHPELLARLKEIREYVARCRTSCQVEPGAPAGFRLYSGICGNVGRITTDPEVEKWLHSASRHWPKFSGTIKFPVPGPGDVSAERAYTSAASGRDMWVTGTYADNRFELLEFLIARLEKSETAHPHAALMALYAQDAARTAEPSRLWQFRTHSADSWSTFGATDLASWWPHTSYRRHPHADLMLEWEKDQRENPGQVWQCRSNTDDAPWRDMQGTITWQESLQYRRKPKVRRIGGYEYPEPESKAPPIGARYWLAGAGSKSHATEYVWRGTDGDQRFLERGLVHLPEEAAAAHGRAMVHGWTT